MQIDVNSYFCGAGLFDVGLIEGGLNIKQAFELDKDAVKTYKHNLGDHIKHCDLTEELVLEQESCDCMVFTYPCTKYSRIADIHKTRTGDELFLHALRHLAIARPETYLIENVPGMNAFPLVIEAMTRLPDYYVTVFCPVESSLFVPQNRSRLIIFATRKPFNVRPPENTKPITLRQILEKEPEIKIPKSVYTRLNGGYRDMPIISDPERGDIAPTCVAHYSKDKSTRLVVDPNFPMSVRPYTVREYARLQGLADTFIFPVCDTSAYKQIGNGVTRHVGIWAGKELKRYFELNRGLRLA